ncbi:uncharacterized protein METZ01_LOCUS142855, partial [marine metagenome]
MGGPSASNADHVRLDPLCLNKVPSDSKNKDAHKRHFQHANSSTDYESMVVSHHLASSEQNG